MGGRNSFNSKLDSVFSLPPVYDESYYGMVIHEIREMQITNTGQYAHGNQPVQHMIYLYNYSGQPWKTQNRLRQIMDKLYSSAPDGYCGDEDNGQTSTWFVFSALGFYPVCPGTQQYVIGSPLFDRVELKLENGNSFVIRAQNNGSGKPYLQSVKLNGQDHGRTWISHQEITDGGKLEFSMGDIPDKTWGTDLESAPFSMSK